MARLIICLMIIPASFFVGKLISDDFFERTILLSKIKLMLSSIKAILSFEGLPTAEIVEKLSSDSALSKLSFLSEANSLLKKGVPFPTAWKEALENKRLSPLKEKELEILRSLGGVLGSFDKETQLSRLLLLESQTDELIETSKSEEKTTGVLIKKLSLFAGTALFILAV